MNFLSSIGSTISSAFGGVKDFFTKPVPASSGSGQASTPFVNTLSNIGQVFGTGFLGLGTPRAGGDIPIGTPGTQSVLTGSGNVVGKIANPEEIATQQRIEQAATNKFGTSPFFIPTSTSRTDSTFNPQIRPSRPLPPPPPPPPNFNQSSRTPPQGQSGTPGQITGNTSSFTGRTGSISSTGQTGTQGTTTFSPAGNQASTGTAAFPGQTINPNTEEPRRRIPFINNFTPPAGFTKVQFPGSGDFFREDATGLIYIPNSDGNNTFLDLAPNSIPFNPNVNQATNQNQNQISGFTQQQQIQPSGFNQGQQTQTTTLEPPKTQPFEFKASPFNAGSPGTSINPQDLQGISNTLQGFQKELSSGITAERQKEIDAFVKNTGTTLRTQFGSDVFPENQTKSSVENIINQQGGDVLKNFNANNPTPNDTGTPVSVNDANQQRYLDSLDPVSRSIAESRLDQFKGLQAFTYTDNAGHRYNGVPALEANRIDLLKQINALNLQAAKVYHDNLNNNDLPTSVSFARIKAFNEQNDIAIKNLQGQLGTVSDQIGFANEAVNSALGITQFAQQQNYKEQQFNREFIQQLISQGTLGGYNDQQLQQLAQRSGYNLGDLQELRDNVKNRPFDVRSLQTLTGATLLGMYKNKDGSYSYKQLGQLSALGNFVGTGQGTGQEGNQNQAGKPNQPAQIYDPQLQGQLRPNLKPVLDKNGLFQISPITTGVGTYQYVDGTKLKGKAGDTASVLAAQEGLPYINNSQSINQLTSAHTSYLNLLQVIKTWDSVFSKNFATRLVNAPAQLLQNKLQSDSVLAARDFFKNTFAPKLEIALSGLSPGRINFKLIEQVKEGYINSDDTYATALQKTRQIFQALDNSVKSTLQL